MNINNNIDENIIESILYDIDNNINIDIDVDKCKEWAINLLHCYVIMDDNYSNIYYSSMLNFNDNLTPSYMYRYVTTRYYMLKYIENHKKLS